MSKTATALRATIFLGLLLLLPGCAHAPAPAPGVRVEYRDVVREVERPCPVAVPVRPSPLERPLPSDPARLVDLLTAKLTEWAGEGMYGDKAQAALDRCAHG